MTEISSSLWTFLCSASQMFTFANIGPVLDNTVSFKNLINKTCSNKGIGAKRINVYKKGRM